MWKLTLYVKQITLNVKKIRLSKCIKHLDSKCVKNRRYMCKLYFDAICENLILMLAKSLNGKHIYPLHLQIE